MSRYFAPISIENLRAKIEIAEKDDGFNGLLDHLGKDIKVQFDTENIADDESDFGPKKVLGYQTLPSGLTFRGYAAGGDWEHPVFVAVYWDGKKLRGYVPTEGNPWNTTTKRAYGNDVEADLKNARHRWPDLFNSRDSVESDDFAFDADDIRRDLESHILHRDAEPKPVLPSKTLQPPILAPGYWAISVIVPSLRPGRNHQVALGFITANDYDTALGKATRTVSAKYNAADGWGTPIVLVSRPELTTIDGVIADPRQ